MAVWRIGGELSPLFKPPDAQAVDSGTREEELHSAG
jgi:hypothetical protein